MNGWSLPIQKHSKIGDLVLKYGEGTIHHFVLVGGGARTHLVIQDLQARVFGWTLFKKHLLFS